MCVSRGPLGYVKWLTGIISLDEVTIIYEVFVFLSFVEMSRVCHLFLWYIPW